MKKYLFWFANEHVDFKFCEVCSILSLLNIKAHCLEQPKDDPFWIIELDSDESVKRIASRSVTLRYAIELWARAKTVDQLHLQLKSSATSFLKPYSSPNTSFKIKVETFCNSQTQAEKVAKIETFSYLPLEGPVKLKNPDLTLQYIEHYGTTPVKQKSDPPQDLFFGRMVAEGQRDLISKINLKTRKFIGNTSMDPQLSLIMANAARMTDGDLVLDPFVGSGSLLIAAAQFGGYVLGADIDYLMIHGKSRPTRKQCRDKPRVDESVLTNMIQYNLQSRYLDIVVADSSLPFWRPNLILDAIVTDPPYGIREAIERVGTTRDFPNIKEEHLKTHIPSKVQYDMTHLMRDLMRFSVNHLKVGGRLITWIPVIRSEYSEKDLPSHECLKLVYNCEQILSLSSSRRMLVYEKLTEPEPDAASLVTICTNSTVETYREKLYKLESRKEKRLKKDGR